ncbi:hypothetical protein pdam_00021920 [Pocillopora damicornis]|uniref:Cytochrome P450 n=1 Tax=Pocillopora damicornis TaxID=46731 RepID=A0A3M6UHW2_POCDA|nr:hypothetical protein pdam_00021920 [Pocillopora damicornis]
MFLVVAISLLLAAVVLISLVLLERHHSADPVRKMPGPKTNLLFGNVLQLPRLPNVTSMDSSPNAQGDTSSPYVEAVGRITELIQKRQRSPWLWPDIVYFLTPSGREHNHCLNILHGFTNEIIDERIADRAAKKNDPQSEENDTEQGEEGEFKRKRRLAFLDLLLEAYDKGEISREGIREEVDTFMFEGHDTTAAGLTWALYLLARHPHIQQQVHEEVDKFFEQRPETLTGEDLKDLRYLECVVKEAQRMFPSVPFIARRTTEDCHLDGYLAPKGTAIGVCTIGLHRNPKVWEAPLEFNPDRFLPENSQGRHPYAFVPFSAGPRNCIGQRFALQEEKLVLAHLWQFARLFAAMACVNQAFPPQKLNSNGTPTRHED